MNILWFTNTPALASSYLKSNYEINSSGGWLYSLNQIIQNEVTLSVVFHYPYKLKPFKFENTFFYPVYTGNLLLEGLKRRFFRKIYKDDFLDKYLLIIKKVKPTLIHIHGTENPFIALIGKTDVPIVVSIQGVLNVYQHKFLSGYNGDYIDYNLNNISLKSIIFGNKNFGRDYKLLSKFAKFEKHKLVAAKYIIGRTSWDCRVCKILSPQSTYFHGDELLRDEFYINVWNNPYKGGTIRIFTTNSDNYYKGFETLCYALFNLNNLGLDIEWRVAGISEESLITKITRKYLKGKFPTRGLILLGSLNQKQLVNNICESHLYVMPSHIENSPNNLCEAMALGIPCISTFSGGSSSILKDGFDGILIQDGDPWAMAGAIIEMIKNIELSINYASNAREHALLRHNKENVKTQYISIYRKIIEIENSSN